MKAIIAIVLLAVISLIALFAMSSNTVLTINPEVKTVGVTTPVTVKISNPHGVRRTAAYIEQGGARFPLTEVKTPAHRFFWRRNQAPQTLTFDAGKSKAPNLKEGDARIVVEADADDLAGHTDATSFAVKVILAPPRVAPDDAQHYINQGGMELAVMTPGGSWSEAGVKVGQYTFRSFPLPGHPEQRFAMFAYPWDLADNLTPMVFARNLAGTEATAQFWFKLFPKKFRTRDFPIDDALMSKMVNQIDPGGTLAPGPDILSRFLKINGEMRRRNNQQLADLRLKTEEKILWNGPFRTGARKSRCSPTCAITCTRVSRWTGRCTWASTSPTRRTLRCTWRTTAAWCGPPISGSTAIAWWWTTGTRCNPFTAT